MKRPKTHNFLVSVVKDGKVTGLYWSEALVELNTIKRIHHSEDVSVMDMQSYVTRKTEEVQNIRRKISKNGKPFANRVRCIETGVIYNSVSDACHKLGIPRVNIYKAIRMNAPTAGYHFEFLPPFEPSKE